MTRRSMVKALHAAIRSKIMLENALAGGEPVLVSSVYNEGTADEIVFRTPVKKEYLPNWLEKAKERIEFWQSKIAARDQKRSK